jgi:hypothetical protein
VKYLKELYVRGWKGTECFKRRGPARGKVMLYLLKIKNSMTGTGRIIKEEMLQVRSCPAGIVSVAAHCSHPRSLVSPIPEKCTPWLLEGIKGLLITILE